MLALNTLFRTDKHGTPFEHGASLALAGPRAATMRVAKAGCLRVEKGAAWITVTPVDERAQADDVVLHTGECIKLAAGQEFVMESWVLAKSRRASRYVSVRWEKAR